ncbi:hypothetical protein [Streptomyces sp. NPDC000410]|uniref:hypothetical protein n=1 Tax=Streptomyces sp. NPDC000410 TaxID=3154254 RepID=UPI003322BE3C
MNPLFPPVPGLFDRLPAGRSQAGEGATTLLPGVAGPPWSWLLVPASRWREELRDPEAGPLPDAVILDVHEDEAGPGPARAAAAAALEQSSRPGSGLGQGRPWLRIHPVDSPECRADVEALARLGAGLVLPRTTSAVDVDRLTALCPGVRVMPVLEDQEALSHAVAIAGRSGVAWLGFSSRRVAVAWARPVLVNACAAAGIPGPVNAVHTAPEDAVAVVHEAAESALAGFAGQCVNRREQLRDIHTLHDGLATLPARAAG